MKQKHLAVALSAIFAAAALTGCGSDNGDYTYDPETPPVVTPPTDGGETPPTDGGETPPTDGGETPPVVTPPTDGNDDNTGAAAEGNLDLNTNTTVGGQQYVRGNNANFDRVLNPAADNKNANATVLNGKTLQNKKLDNIVIGRETVNRADGTAAEAVRFAGKGIDGVSRPDASGTKQLQEYNVANGVDVTETDNELNGLVVIERESPTSALFKVEGQENASAPSNLAKSTGSNLNTRIFGNKYREDGNIADQNSVRFVANKNADGNYVIVNDTATDLVNDANKSSFKTLKLDDVQYGRVTSNLNKLDNASEQDGITYYESEISSSQDRQANLNGTVDTYFYRGTNETKLEQMNALKADSGNIAYAGHALMYGIDNSYHGNLGDPTSNAFGDADKAISGQGNFVQANLNLADKKLTGNIFNVWKVTPNVDGTLSTTNVFKEDKLVNFEGTVYGNTAKGTSQLAYGSNKDLGTFKGTFFGDQAQELGGAVNSVTDSYGAPAWGGVFGAQQVKVPETTNPGGNANQTE